MIRNIIGSVIMLFFGLTIIYGVYDAVYGDEQEGAVAAIVILLPIFLSGYWLRKSGKRSYKNNRIIKEYALKRQSEYGFVNALDVSENSGINMIEATKILRKLEKKSLIKIDAKGKSENLKNYQTHLNDEISISNIKKYENKMKQLNCLLEENLITEDEYEKKCHEISFLLKDEMANNIGREAKGKHSENDNVIVVDGIMKVNDLIAQFADKLNLGVRIYNGRKFADGGSKLSEIGFYEKQPAEIAIHKNRKIGKFEEYFNQKTGLTIQVEDRNGKLADNNLILSNVS
jgi:hypothetical protein